MLCHARGGANFWRPSSHATPNHAHNRTTILIHKHITIYTKIQYCRTCPPQLRLIACAARASASTASEVLILQASSALQPGRGWSQIWRVVDHVRWRETEGHVQPLYHTCAMWYAFMANAFMANACMANAHTNHTYYHAPPCHTLPILSCHTLPILLLET